MSDTKGKAKAPAPSPTANFLDDLKTKLDAEGVFDALKNSNFQTLITDATVDNSVPVLITEFLGYTNINVPVLNTVDDYNSAVQMLGNLQARFNRTSWAYSSMLSIFNNLKLLRSTAASYIQINVQEIKSLRSNDMRVAAAKYILEDFDKLIQNMAEFYDIIQEVQRNLSRAINNIKLQLELHSTKGHLMHSGKLGTWGDEGGDDRSRYKK